MSAGKQQRTLRVAILLATLAPLLALTSNAAVIPLILSGTTVDLFKVFGYSLAGFLTGYVFFLALGSEDA